MTLETIIGIAIAACVGVLGFLGKSLYNRMDAVELEVYKRTSYGDVRRIVEDKMSPVKVEYMSLARRIDEIKSDQHKLNDKLDRLLVICTKLAHEDR